MDVIGSNPSLGILKKNFRNQMSQASLYDVFFGTGKTHVIPERPWLFVYDGKNTFTLEMDLDCSTVADLFEEVVHSYGLQLDPKQHMRIIFTDKELKFSRKKRLSEYGIISHSTIGVIFRLPDAKPASVAAASSVAPMETRRKPSKPPVSDSSGKQEKDERRPKLRRWPGRIELTNLQPDFLDYELNPSLYRAIMPCGHVIGSESMREYVKNVLDNGAVKVLCPYTTALGSPNRCPADWNYTLVRHVACFTTDEMHNTEKTIAINFVGKEKTSLNCPGCFTWCSPADPRLTRLRCFHCTKATGEDFLFCRHCLGKWRNFAQGEGCGNSGCNSIEAKLEMLRTAPVTQLFGGTWPTIRACPRCGILTHYLGQCSQMHCQSCGHYYCFLCLKGAKSKAELQCIPYESDCQRASLQTSIPEWDGHDSD